MVNLREKKTSKTQMPFPSPPQKNSGITEKLLVFIYTKSFIKLQKMYNKYNVKAEKKYFVNF